MRRASRPPRDQVGLVGGVAGQRLGGLGGSPVRDDVVDAGGEAERLQGVRRGHVPAGEQEGVVRPAHSSIQGFVCSVVLLISRR